ncbi:MAG: epoxyqueuosine reductase family protein [Planctomycetota bacterium]|jgi:epoxyqueuosine reductase QueG
MERTQKNFQMIKSLFNTELKRIRYNGIIGVTGFKNVYRELMPVQRNKLKQVCKGRFQSFMEEGSIICLGIAYPEYVIDCIDVKFEDGTIDRNTWNIYTKEYKELNRILNDVSKGFSERFGGFTIPATIEGIASKIQDVEEYSELTVSHRVIAENAGLGWRGKNELIVNEAFSCALRFASVLTTLPLIQSGKVENLCGVCDACLEACSFLRNKEKLENYREGCRRYIMQLNLDADVCGKCIKACYKREK